MGRKTILHFSLAAAMLILFASLWFPASVPALAVNFYAGDAASFKKALEKAKSGDSIIITGNIDYTAPVIIDRISITVDLAGNALNISVQKGDALTVKNEGTLTIVG